jgi:hypothetical protein
MAEQVDVCVKNLSVNDIEVYREMADGSRDLNGTIAGGEEDTRLLPDPEVFLVISTPDVPDGGTTQNCSFNVTLNEEVVEWSVMDDYHWKVQVSENTRPPEAPTTVNVDIGGPPPAP